jgi:hypothetical protein
MLFGRSRKFVPQIVARHLGNPDRRLKFEMAVIIAGFRRLADIWFIACVGCNTVRGDASR